jgi:hypothetical protein
MPIQLSKPGGSGHKSTGTQGSPCWLPALPAWTGYQPVDFKHLGFEFKKLKNDSKNTS